MADAHNALTEGVWLAHRYTAHNAYLHKEDKGQSRH